MNRPKNDFFAPRKCQVGQNAFINLYGARGSGKTSLIIDWLDNLDGNSLYIDMLDPKILFESLTLKNLDIYIKEKMITTVVLDHYDNTLLDNLPTCERVVVVTRIRANIKNFTPIRLETIDYEEFLGFETNVSQTNGFSHFYKTGLLPAFLRSNKSTQLLVKDFLFSRFESQEIRLLSLLAIHNTKELTINQIYTYAKKTFKISKDWLYKKIDEFVQEGIVYFVEDFSKRGSKRVVLYDITLSGYLSSQLNFGIHFESLVLLSLLKRDNGVYAFNANGYLVQPDKLIICAPFESEDRIWVKTQKIFSEIKKEGIKKVEIVTVSNSYRYTIENILFEALPYYEWSIVEED
jgi:cellulose biosynthesis protein BcsQ